MEIIKINKQNDFNDLLEFLNEEYPDYHKEYIPDNEYHIHTDDQLFVVNSKFFETEKSRTLKEIKKDMEIINKQEPKFESPYSNHLIYGKNETEQVIAVEIVNDNVLLFLNDGTTKSFPNVYWFLTARKIGQAEKLEGNLHYNYIHRFNNKEDFDKERSRLKYQKKLDIYTIWDDVEAAMVYFGITLFKGLKVEDVSRLHFDIETAGLVKNQDSKVFVITNTFVSKDKRIKKTFRLDHYQDDVEMIEDWCKWVQEINPCVINGHNIIGYDIPYLDYCYGVRDGHDRGLPIGRDCSAIKIGRKPRKFRVDGSNEWDYCNIDIFGRHVIDGMFTCVKYDFKRNYPSWGLKPIIDFEHKKASSKKVKERNEMDKRLIKLQKDRQFYDASLIKENWKDLEEREKIVSYCQDDSDDSEFLYDLQINSYFYFCQYIPMPFQTINNAATGKPIDQFLVRSYIQQGHGIDKASEFKKFGGGISFGIPGVYKNSIKWDVSALYPSIILTYDIYDRQKDPKANYYEMVKHFATTRLKNKKLAKETGDRYYKDLEQSQKIVANSSYGVLGTPGLIFNSFDNADMVTSKGREIIKTSILWATGKQYKYWYEKFIEMTNSKFKETADISPIDKKFDCHDFLISNCDTDSISVVKKNGTKFTEEENNKLIIELNSLMTDGIVFEDDGSYKKFLVLKAKNYVKDDGRKVTYQGSSILDSKKEPKLKEFMLKICDLLMNNKKDHIFFLYNQYCREILDIQDINKWAKKVNITKSILDAESAENPRENELKPLRAIKGKDIQEGDKCYMYYDKDENLRLVEDFDGEYNIDTYLTKLYNTLKIFGNVIDVKLFPDYSLKKNRELL